MNVNRAAGARRPNIIFLIADDHRYDGIGAYGNPVVRTPVLDRLAAQGALLESVYIMGGQSAAVCVPSRASLMTGGNVFRTTAASSTAETENRRLWELNPALPTFPQLFRERGYHTFATGKWHNGKESFARSFADGAGIFFGGMGDHVGLPVQPYDPHGEFPDSDAKPSEAFSSELFADAAVDFIGSYRGEEPYLLYVAFTAPHDPRTPPPEYAALYAPDEIPLPDNYMARHPFDNGELAIRDEELAPLPRTPEAIRRHLADYYGMISHMDAQIGRILQALRDSGREEDTLIVYTADHGLALGQHGLLGKQNLYEHSIHIPLVIAGPGVPQGVTVGGLGCQMDIFPTLCELAGIDCPETVEGRSLAPLIAGQAEAVRPDVFAVYKDMQRMVSDGRWKLIRYYRSDGKGAAGRQLFDLETDPWEMNNLLAWDGYADRLSQMERRLLEWQRQVGDPLLERAEAQALAVRGEGGVV
ncbi:MAG: sulfatase-like hydrolase/transferase [Paenibacillaceae bacterium]|nr:sulfatase-like hydrolase/transferase [Paenibacillaceae bacterium]